MMLATYEEWIVAKRRALVREAEDEEDLEEAEAFGNESVVKPCKECEGDGWITDYGVLTGKDFEVDCPACKGKGEVPATGDDVRLRESFAKYEIELKSDLVALAQWTGRPAHIVLTEAGFICWSQISDKQLQCSISDVKCFSGVNANVDRV